MQLDADFLNLRRLVVQFCFESVNFLLLLRGGCSLFLRGEMFFGKLVEQHCIDLLVADGFGLAFRGNELVSPWFSRVVESAAM